MRILFVCLGNICRSPTAEGVMRHLVEQAGLAGEIEIESAGTGSWHIGSGADPRSAAAASSRGYRLESISRQVSLADFEEFDMLIAMDRSNRDDLLALAPHARDRIHMMREFAGDSELDVPDPYHGGPDGFDDVLDILERNCAALLDRLRNGPAGVG